MYENFFEILISFGILSSVNPVIIGVHRIFNTKEVMFEYIDNNQYKI